MTDAELAKILRHNVLAVSTALMAEERGLIQTQKQPPIHGINCMWWLTLKGEAFVAEHDPQ